MAKSLRDEVAELRDANQGSWLGEHLRQMLTRHPPADGVSVPRELLSDLRDTAKEMSDDLAHQLENHPCPYPPTVRQKEIVDAEIAQADAILTEGKA